MKPISEQHSQASLLKQIRAYLLPLTVLLLGGCVEDRTAFEVCMRAYFEGMRSMRPTAVPGKNYYKAAQLCKEELSR